MALDIQQLAGKTAVIDVPFMGQSTRVTYNPSVLTQEALIKAQDGTDEGFIEFFTTLVKAWDVTKGKNKVPLTKNGLTTVPLILLRAIFMAIMGEAGNGEAGKASNAG